MLTFKTSKNSVNHFPIVLTLSTNCLIDTGSGYSITSYRKELPSTLEPHQKVVSQGTEIVLAACKTHKRNLSNKYINWLPSDHFLTTDIEIKDGEVQCKNCLRALGLLENIQTSDGYLFALRCTLSGEYQRASGSLTPHLTDAKFYKTEKVALGKNSIMAYKSLSGNVLTYIEYRKLTEEARKEYMSIRMQNSKFEIIKVSLVIEK